MVETSDFKEPKFFGGPWTDPPPKNGKMLPKKLLVVFIIPKS